VPFAARPAYSFQEENYMSTEVEVKAPHRMTVLLVDDSPANLIVFGDILQPEYNVRVANSGQRALEIVDTDPVPDIILLDVMMPKMDGYAVMNALQEHPKHRDIPVIFVTSIDQTENVEFGLALGAVDFISKPIKPGILLARVKTQLTIKSELNQLKRQNELMQDELHRLKAENKLLKDAAQDALNTVNAMNSLFASKASNPLSDEPPRKIGDTFVLDLDATPKP
jgi:putative two-component system response regulator